MLDGTRPFAGVSTPDSWMRRAREGPKALSGSVDGVRARTDAVIRKCLAYDPGERYQSAAELVGALSSTRLSFVLPDDRRMWLVAAAVVLAVLGATGFAAWRWFTPQLPPAEAMKWFEEAQQALAEGASVRALNNVNRAIELAPWFAPSHVLLAEVRLELDMPGRAQEAMLKANELARLGRQPSELYVRYMNGVQALLLRQCDQAIEEFRAFASVNDSMRPYRMVSAARAMERCDRPDDALAVMGDAGTVDPRNAAVPLRRARLLIQRRDWREAALALGTADTLFRDRNNAEGASEVLITQALLASEQDKLDDADKLLSRAAAVATSLDDARQRIRVLLQQAITARKRGDVAGAGRLTADAIDFARNADLETLTIEGLFTAGNVHLVRNQFSAAQELFERALTIADTYRHDEYRARAQLALASVFVQTMRPSLAAKALDAAGGFYARVRQTRNLAIGEALRGQVLMMSANYPAAIKLFEAQIASSAGSGDSAQVTTARQNLASALASTGRYADALREYQQVLASHVQTKRARSETLTLFNIADTYSRMGRSTDAMEFLHRAYVRALEPELVMQGARIEASIALRAGRIEEAYRAATRVVDDVTDGSAWRRLRGSLLVCITAARTNRVGVAAGACDDSLAALRGSDHAAMRFEGGVTVSEAFMALGLKQEALPVIRELESALDSVPEHEDRWRVMALAYLSSEATASSSLLARVTEELAFLRVLWTDEEYMTWSHRSDVAGLLKQLVTRGLPKRLAA
jgi:tetratricopeptide (TPR) repeat protein